MCRQITITQTLVLHNRSTKAKKKKRFVSQTFAKKAKCYAFFFFFFRENSYANAIFFFFFFNQNIQLAYKKNNAIHSYFPFYHENEKFLKIQRN